MSAAQSLNGSHVFVTGGTGFIGLPLVQALLQRGAVVSALTRSSHGRRKLTKLGVTCVGADEMGRALSDCQTVFNLAYDVRASGDENVESFERILVAAMDAGVPEFVHSSSAVVYDDWPLGDINEMASISHEGSSYKRAKATMEARLLEAEIHATILQPTIVYGPRSALWTAAIVDQLRKGPVILPDCDSRCNAVFVDDVVQASLKSFGQSKTERYIISGPDNISWRRFFEAHIDILETGSIELQSLDALKDRIGNAPQSGKGKPSAAAQMSARLRNLIGRENFERIMAQVRRIRPQKGPVYPNATTLALYSGTGSCDISKAREFLGYEPQFDLIAGLNASRSYINTL